MYIYIYMKMRGDGLVAGHSVDVILTDRALALLPSLRVRARLVRSHVHGLFLCIPLL